MAEFLSSATHKAWLDAEDWAGLEWRARVPLALGSKNSFNSFEPVEDDRTLLCEPSRHRSSRMVNPGGYVSIDDLWCSFPFFWRYFLIS